MALASAAVVESGIDPPLGILGDFSPRRYWISRLLGELPGVIGGPCLPAARTPAKSAIARELAGVRHRGRMRNWPAKSGALCRERSIRSSRRRVANRRIAARRRYIVDR